MTAVIELNGRKYDAVSGRLLDNAEKPKHAAPTKGTAMDFVRPATNGVRQHTPAAPAAAKPSAATASKAAVTRAQPKHVAAHQPQHAKTLMRRSVSKPGASFKKQAKASSHTGALIGQPNAAVALKQPVLSIDENRLRRAHHVPHSKLVRHFDTLNFARPAATPKAAGRTAPVASAITPAVSPVYRVASPATTPAGTPSAARPSPRQSSTDIFERALAQATSHKQPYHPVKRSKAKKTHRGRTALSIAASSLAVLLIAGFIAYQNATVIQLRLVSSRAGIAATLPRWKPSGFSVGKFAYAPGSVTVNFNDAQTNSNFTITQVATKWDSNALLNNYVNPNASTTYNTIESAGSTIYTYGNNSATWVNNNIWYRLDTGGSLSTSQIVQIATSM